MLTDERRRVQRRTVWVLSIAQALGGVASGLVLGVGALLMAQVTGSESFAGLSATLTMIGSSIAAVPLARMASRFGRRAALSAGSFGALAGTIIITLGGVLWSAPIVMIGFVAVGIGTTVGLQSRFAAADLAAPEHRGRDLSIVVWATTIGVIVGPNLISLGDAIGERAQWPHFVGAYLLAAIAQLATGIVIVAALRPDPLLSARRLADAAATSDAPAATGEGAPAERVRLTRMPVVLATVVVVAAAHATMVGVMSMTPIHLDHAHFSLGLIGVTMSAHMAGMYALSPLFGWSTDRLGPVPTMLAGQAIFGVSIAVSLIWGADGAIPALVFLGLGWSAVLVAGSALVTQAAPAGARPAVQGRSDLVMGVFGAAAGAGAGPLMGWIGYAGLNLAALAVVLCASVLILRVRHLRRFPRQRPDDTQGSVESAP